MIKNLENKAWELVRRISPKLYAIGFKRRRVVRYIISGGTAAVVNIGLLAFFTEVFGIWYVISAAMSFVVALTVSFLFQKFWTFEDHSTEGVHGQAFFYLLIALINLFINTSLIYLFVEYMYLHYVSSQILAGIIIACESFFIYRGFIFNNNVATSQQDTF